jgi:hypothetical protein
VLIIQCSLLRLALGCFSPEKFKRKTDGLQIRSSSPIPIFITTMDKQLEGARVAIVVTDGFEQDAYACEGADVRR